MDWLAACRRYLLTVASLHFVWEWLQLPFYTIWRTGSWPEIAFSVIHCTAADVVIAAVALLGGVTIFANGAWPRQRFAPVAAATVAFGVAYTIYSEWMNTSLRNTWQYSELMPTLPWLGTGLSPLLQWFLVPAIGFCPLGRRSRLAA